MTRTAMKHESRGRQRSPSVLLVSVATLALFMMLVGLSARSLSIVGSERGAIRLDDIYLLDESGQLLLNADVDIDLPKPIRDGLNSGVPLDFIVTLRFRQKRPLWRDRTLVEYRNHFRLSYYELTRHYRLHALESDVSHNYRSLSSALDGLGSIRRLPLVNTGDRGLDTIMEQAQPVFAGLSFRLDSQSLPLPLQPLIASSWRLASEEYLWQAN